jgi:mono/diheme cytochrome c family protein
MVPAFSALTKANDRADARPAFGLVGLTRILLGPALLLIGAAANGQSPDAEGDRAKGRALALEECTACHDVESHRRSPPLLSNAPPFVAVANTEGTTAVSLNAFLENSHKTMPNFVLSPSQQRDVISYILGLRGR